MMVFDLILMGQRHAGYRYSGASAAYCYQGLAKMREKVKRIFLIGPSHHMPFTGCALPSASMSHYETPLGDICLDLEVIEELSKTGKEKRWLRLTKEEDEAEHSLEMHLPYIYHAMGGEKGYSLVPIMVGSLESGLEDEYGEILAPFAENPQNFFIISSDFCHWGKRFNYTPFNSKTHTEIYKYITDLDRQGMDAIETESVANFRKYLHQTKNTICGRNPILVLLAIHAHSKTPFSTHFVHYAQSSQCASSSDSSVSYASALVYPQSLAHNPSH